MRQMSEKIIKQSSIDIEKAFDAVNKNKIWYTLRNRKTTPDLIKTRNVIRKKNNKRKGGTEQFETQIKLGKAVYIGSSPC